GTRVHLAKDAVEALAAKSPDDLDAIGLLLDAPAEHSWTLSSEAWMERRSRLVDAPFSLLKRALSERSLQAIFGVTVLGGGLGFENAAQSVPEHGGLIGLLKALRRELASPAPRLLALDTAPSASADAVAAAVLAELDAGVPRLEVGLLRG